MKKYTFETGKWEKDFTYAYSLVAKSYKPFVQEGDSVVNTFNEEIQDYDYVSVAYKTKQKTGVQVSLLSSFDKFGAPLLTFANSLERDEEGRTTYGEHYEVVLYEGGCNVWHIVKAPEGAEKKYINTQCAGFEFFVADFEKVDMRVAVEHKKFKIFIKEHVFEVEAPLLEDEFFVGATACEGINHLYAVEFDGDFQEN